MTESLPTLSSGDSLTEYERRYCTASAQAGLRLIRRLGDPMVLAAARHEDSLSFAAVLRQMGLTTNRSWVTARCAETAYERGLIDERELDLLCR